MKKRKVNPLKLHKNAVANFPLHSMYGGADDAEVTVTCFTKLDACNTRDVIRCQTGDACPSVYACPSFVRC